METGFDVFSLIIETGFSVISLITETGFNVISLITETGFNVFSLIPFAWINRQKPAKIIQRRPTVVAATTDMGPFKCYVTQMGVGGVRFSRKKRYECVMFNVISVTRGWVGVQFAEK